MKSNKIMTLTIILILFQVSLQAQFGAELQQGCRQQGMGGAFTGLADDGEAVYYNPAGLVNLRDIEMITMYSRQAAHMETAVSDMGINVSYLGYAQNFGDEIGSFSGRYYYRGYNFGSTFGASEHLFMLGYGRKLTDLLDLYPDLDWLDYLRPLSVGIGIKFMRFGFSDAAALADNDYAGNDEDLADWTWSMDMSFFYKFRERYSFGFQFKDFNRPNSSIIANEKTLDKMDYTFGFAWKYSKNMRDVITADMSSENKNYAFNFGTEKYWDFVDIASSAQLDRVVVRSGFRIGFEHDYNWSFGLGYLMRDFGEKIGSEINFDLRFDYSYKVMFGNINDGPTNHTIQMVFTLPEW